VVGSGGVVLERIRGTGKLPRSGRAGIIISQAALSSPRPPWLVRHRAVAQGARRFKTLVVYAAAGAPVAPCGLCRQMLNEFAPGLKVVCVTDHERAVYRLNTLLPHAFSAAAMGGRTRKAR